MTEVDVSYDSIQVGDLITVYFYPYSQRYIDILHPITGRVVDKGESEESMILEDLEGKRYAAFHGGVHFFGMTLGYGWNITKLIGE